MATTAEIVDYSNRILTAAQTGTPTNPQGVPSPVAALMLAMAKHETGNFTSNGFKSGNNAFGYSYVAGGKWQDTQPGAYADNGLPLAKYPTVENSAREIVDWIYRRMNEGTFPALATVTEPTQFAMLLRNNRYYTDTLTNYANGLKRWYVPLPSSGGTAAGGKGTGGIVLVIAAVIALGFAVTHNKKKTKRA